MRLFFALVVGIHGLIHLMGFAKGFDLAALPNLTQPIARPAGLLWLAAALLLFAAALAWVLWPRWFVPLGLAGVMVSQLVIVLSWADAKYGTLGNLILLGGIAVTLLSRARP